MNAYAKAREYQNKGEYREAATEYALIGFEELLNGDFESDRRMLVGLGLFLRAISCDIQEGNVERATHLQAITEQLYQEMHQRRIMETDAEEQCVKGLVEEWIGDSRLMIGSDQVIKQYEKAIKRYEDLDFDVRMGWGMEEKFDQTQWAFEFSIDNYDYTFPEDVISDYLFIERVEFKIQVAEELLSQHTANESADCIVPQFIMKHHDLVSRPRVRRYQSDNNREYGPPSIDHGRNIIYRTSETVNFSANIPSR